MSAIWSINFNKRAKNTKWSKERFTNNWSGGYRTVPCKKPTKQQNKIPELRRLSFPQYKNQIKMDQRPQYQMSPYDFFCSKKYRQNCFATEHEYNMNMNRTSLMVQVRVTAILKSD